MSATSIVRSKAPRVLVAENESLVRAALIDLLQGLGILVVGEAADGHEAVAVAATCEPEVVLMDLRMPGLDGLEATRLIKQRLPNVQVVILTAYDDPGLRRGADEAGVYCYLVKGCPPSLIRQVIDQARDFQRQLESGRGSTAVPNSEAGRLEGQSSG